jgi:hypothetical protein
MNVAYPVAGVATETVMAYYMSWLLFGLVMCLYGVLFGINSGNSSRLFVVLLMGSMLLVSAAQFYSICSKADCIMNVVSVSLRASGLCHRQVSLTYTTYSEELS